MPSAGEIRTQVEFETERRNRLAVPALAGGVLYMLGTIIISSTLGGEPSVGLLQGLAPALSGVASPGVSPRAPEVKYVSHHAVGLIAGSVLAGLAIGVLTLVLLLLLSAARFRRPETWRAARPLVLYGGIVFALTSFAHQVVLAIRTHEFAVGHSFSNHAVDQALTEGAANSVVNYFALLAGLSLAAGMIAVTLNSQRVGLLPRWMGMLGMLTAVLIFLPIGAQLQIFPAFWLVGVGILFAGRWPKPGTPEAWAAGEARPWPTAAQRRAERMGDGKPAPRRGKPAVATAAEAPALAPASSSGRRRRKRSGRH